MDDRDWVDECKKNEWLELVWTIGINKTIDIIHVDIFRGGGYVIKENNTDFDLSRRI